jgi:hypothetical protein
MLASCSGGGAGRVGKSKVCVPPGKTMSSRDLGRFWRTEVQDGDRGRDEGLHRSRHPGRAVEVLVREIPKSHWGIGGCPACEMQFDEPPRP